MKIKYNNKVELQEWHGKDEGKKVWVRHDDNEVGYRIEIDTSWQMGIEGNRHVQYLLINDGPCITKKMIMDDDTHKLSYRQNLLAIEILHDETEDGLYVESKPNIIKFVNDVILFQFGLFIESYFALDGAKIVRDWQNEKYSQERNKL